MSASSHLPNEHEEAGPEPLDPIAARLAVAILTDESMQAAFNLLRLSDWLTEERNRQ